MFRSLIHRLRRSLRWLLEQDGTPRQRASGLAIGVFSGCFPLFGFQILLAITLATVLRANRLLAVAGTWISNPITYLPIYFFNYRVGCTVLGKGIDVNSWRQLELDGLWQQGWRFGSRLLLGSFLVGIGFGLLIWTVVYFILIKSSRKAGPLNN